MSWEKFCSHSKKSTRPSFSNLTHLNTYEAQASAETLSPTRGRKKLLLNMFSCDGSISRESHLPGANTSMEGFQKQASAVVHMDEQVPPMTTNILTSRRPTAYDPKAIHGNYLAVSQDKKKASENQFGAKVTEWNWSLLCLVCSAKPAEVLQFLSNQICNPYDLESAVFESGRNILAYAALRNDSLIIDEILSLKPDLINKPDDRGYTALHYAVKYRKMKSIMSLLKGNADISVPNTEGRSPLALAALKQNPEAFLALVAYGGKVTAKDKYGVPAVAYFHDHKLVRQLTKIDGSNDTLCPDSCLHSNSNKPEEDPLITKRFSDKKRTLYARLGIGIERDQRSSARLNNYCDKYSVELAKRYRYEKNRNYMPDCSVVRTAVVPKTPLPTDYVIEDTIGSGSFGEVFCARKRATGQLCALKVFSKRQMLGSSLVRFLQVEKKIMMNFNHPFLLNLQACFQTDKKLYLVMEYCEKGDFGRYLKYNGPLNESKARLLISEIILAVETLHQHHFIHRDIKPENILVTKSGHVKLGDYGLCKELKGDTVLTDTFCGSVSYLPPEIIARTGHGKSADWYLVGELLYECIYGQPPYFAQSKEKTYDRIITGDLKFPKAASTVSSACQDLIRSLLAKKPSDRLGSGARGSASIKEHTFFIGLDWQKVYAQEYTLFDPTEIPSCCVRNLNQFIGAKTGDQAVDLAFWSYCE